MKNQFSIIMFGLLGLCALASMLLIIVIVSSGGRVNLKTLFTKRTPATTEMKQDDLTTARTDDIIIPDRFKNTPSPLYSTAANTVKTDTIISKDSSLLKKVRFSSQYSCNETISPISLKQILVDNSLFCQKSVWSVQWANSSGKGIRSRREGLSIIDSVVIDSFTNIMWQRYSVAKPLPYRSTDSVIIWLNNIQWQGYSDWRTPQIDELMATLLPRKNRSGLHLPSGWNCNASDIWTCNSAGDSLSVEWKWVVRTALGRCNLGHPDTARSLIAVRSM